MRESTPSHWQKCDGAGLRPAPFSSAVLHITGYATRSPFAAAFVAALGFKAASSLVPSGVPHPVQGSHPVLALYEPLLPSVMSWSARDWESGP